MRCRPPIIRSARKRPCLDTNYYATYNRPNVTLVEPAQGADPDDHGDRRSRPTTRVVRRRRDRLRHRLRRDDRRDHGGRSDHRTRGQSLNDVWAHGPQTYLGLDGGRFPEPVHDHRAGQPVGAVEHGRVDRAACRLGRRSPRADARERASPAIEATEAAQAGWARHLPTAPMLDAAPARQHLVHGRQRAGQSAGVMPYTGGVGPYRSAMR